MNFIKGVPNCFTFGSVPSNAWFLCIITRNPTNGYSFFSFFPNQKSPWRLNLQENRQQLPEDWIYKRVDYSSTGYLPLHLHHRRIAFCFDRCLQMFCLPQVSQWYIGRFHSLGASVRPVSSLFMKAQKNLGNIAVPEAEYPCSTEVEHWSWLNPQDRPEVPFFMWMHIFSHSRSCCSLVGFKTRNLDPMTAKFELFMFYWWLNKSILHSWWINESTLHSDLGHI